MCKGDRMKKLLRILLLLIVLCLTQLPSQAQTFAAPFWWGSALPMTCTVGTSFALTTASPAIGIYYCTATNTWNIAGTLHSITFTVDGGGAVIVAGQYIVGQFGGINACTIVGWSLIADQSGSISIDLDAKASSAPPANPAVPNTTTDKISASAPMILSSAQTASGGSSAISTWTNTRASYDVFAINITGTPTGVTRVSGTIWCQ